MTTAVNQKLAQNTAARTAGAALSTFFNIARDWVGFEH